MEIKTHLKEFTADAPRPYSDSIDRREARERNLAALTILGGGLLVMVAGLLIAVIFAGWTGMNG